MSSLSQLKCEWCAQSSCKLWIMRGSVISLCPSCEVICHNKIMISLYKFNRADLNEYVSPEVVLHWLGACLELR